MRVRLGLRFSSIVAAENIQEEALDSFMIVVPKPFYISMRLVAIKPLCDSFIDFKFQILLILNSLIFFHVPLTQFIASQGYEAINVLQVQGNFQFNKALWPS